MAKRSSGTGRTTDSLRQRRRRQARTAVALATPRWQRDFWLVQEPPVTLGGAGKGWIGLGNGPHPGGLMPMLSHFSGVDPWQCPWVGAWDGLRDDACDGFLEDAFDGPWDLSRGFG